MNDAALTWQVPPAAIALPPGVVHLWRARLTPALAAALAPVLAPAEQQRAARLRFDRDRDRFVAARGSVRHILSRYLDLSPRQVAFDYTDRGKPYLSFPTDLQFNLSHSEGFMLCAVARQPVGVDLEYMRCVSDLAGLTERFFSPAEHQTIQALPPADQPAAFFSHWTGKEAILKALGTGIADLATVELQWHNPGVTLRHLAGQAQGWWLQSLVPAPNYIAAIAAPDAPEQLDCWDADAANFSEVI